KAVDVLEALELEVQVVVARLAEVDAGRRAREPLRRDARVLERAVRALEDQPLLRVEPRGLARADAEERGVEELDVVEEAAPARRELARAAGLRVVEVLGPARRRRLADRVALLDQEPPERVEVRRAREAAAHADDRDRLHAVR